MSTSNPESEDNAPTMIQTSDATTLTNRPAAWASGTVIAYRTVTSLRPHVLVTVCEAFPKRRVWQNFWNGGTKAWIGWELVAGPGRAEGTASGDAGGGEPSAGE